MSLKMHCKLLPNGSIMLENAKDIQRLEVIGPEGDRDKSNQVLLRFESDKRWISFLISRSSQKIISLYSI
jgi:hypothetical protein